MSEEKRNEKGELMELGHEAVHGYRKILFIALGLGAAYLAWILMFWDH